MKKRDNRQYTTTWNDGGRAHLRLRVQRVSKVKHVKPATKLYLASTAFLVAFALSMVTSYGVSMTSPTQPDRIMLSQAGPITP
ncbi:MAG: hypothetical protein VX834_13610 [Myxococcota bacterium]|nr:hypothetical protein [Myxococcota bacterium]